MELTSNLIGGLVVLAIVVYAALPWRRSSTARAHSGDPDQLASTSRPTDPAKRPAVTASRRPTGNGPRYRTCTDDAVPSWCPAHGSGAPDRAPVPMRGPTTTPASWATTMEPVSDEETDARADQNMRRGA